MSGLEEPAPLDDTPVSEQHHASPPESEAFESEEPEPATRSNIMQLNLVLQIDAQGRSNMVSSSLQFTERPFDDARMMLNQCVAEARESARLAHCYHTSAQENDRRLREHLIAQGVDDAPTFLTTAAGLNYPVCIDTMPAAQTQVPAVDTQTQVPAAESQTQLPAGQSQTPLPAGETQTQIVAAAPDARVPRTPPQSIAAAPVCKQSAIGVMRRRPSPPTIPPPASIRRLQAGELETSEIETNVRSCPIGIPVSTWAALPDRSRSPTRSSTWESSSSTWKSSTGY